MLMYFKFKNIVKKHLQQDREMDDNHEDEDNQIHRLRITIDTTIRGFLSGQIDVAVVFIFQKFITAV
jgi:hypothetical protein